MSNKVKKQGVHGGNKVKDPPTTQIIHLDYPVFCLKHVHRNHGFEQCNQAEKIALLDKLAQLSQITWQEIQLAPRYGTGSEKISRSSIRPSLPSFVTADVDYLLALRFDGKKPILVHRNKFIMHLIFIDNKFSVYSH